MEDIIPDALGIREVRSMHTKIRIEDPRRWRSPRSLEVISGKTEENEELFCCCCCCFMEVFVTNRRRLIGRKRENEAAFLHNVFDEAFSFVLKNGRFGTSLHVKQFYCVGRSSRIAGLRGFARR